MPSIFNEAYRRHGDGTNAREHATGRASEAGERELKHDKSLQEIRANEEDFRLFGEFLSRSGRGDIRRQIAEMDPEKIRGGDVERIAKAKNEYLALRERIEEVVEMLNPKMLEKLGEVHPGMRALIGISGSDGIQAALRRHLPALAVRDPGRFNALSEQAARQEDVEKRWEREDEAILTDFKRYGNEIDRWDVEGLLAGEDATSLATRIAQKKNGYFRNVVRMVGPTKESIEQIKREIEGRAAHARSFIQERLSRVGGFVNEIAETLHVTIMAENNKEVYAAILKYAEGEDIPEPEGGMTAKQVEAAIKNRTEAKGAFETARTEAQAAKKKTLLEQYRAAWEAEHKDEFDRRRDEAYENFLKKDLENFLLEAYDEELDKLGERGPKTQAAIDHGYEVFKAEYLAVEANRAEWRQKFLKTYQEPEPEADVLEEWEEDSTAESNWAEGSPEDRQFFHNSFIEDYAENKHMAAYKKGTWHDVSKELFKFRLFEDIFG